MLRRPERIIFIEARIKIEIVFYPKKTYLNLLSVAMGPGIILFLHPANERGHYIVRLFRIGWDIQHDPWDQGCSPLNVVDDPGNLYVVSM